LGPKGLKWLKIHIANLYGFDKAAFEDRVKWVDEHVDQIRETAANPLGGSRWWLTAGDPWQFLAASMDLVAAYESGDPEAYESSLPVHQDGTCNGLQHYAALGGDITGAAQVNLVAGEKPSDVYSHVGKMVEEVIEKDVLEERYYAIMLQGKITRKVVKQTVCLFHFFHFSRALVLIVVGLGWVWVGYDNGIWSDLCWCARSD